MTTQPMIVLDSVTKVFPGSTAPAVSGLSLTIDEGELITLVGPSGCGKTTILKMINRLIEPTSGTIRVAGQDASTVEPHVLRRSIGYVIQQVGLFPHRTIRENIATVPELLGWARAKVAERTEELAGLMGLEASLLDRYPSELSGGQQQRVGVARALAADPPVLLMDEPFGAVDPVVRARLQTEFLDLQRRLGKTVVLVTHDIDEAVMLGTRTAILDIGGILGQFDTPERILSNPASPFVSRFLGEERGLKRLALRPVRGAEMSRGPVVDISEGPEVARRVMAEHDVDWVGLLDGEMLLGWVGADMVDTTPLAQLSPKPFLVYLAPDDSLRKALDAVVTSHARVAAVVDQGRYLGMLDLEQIAEEITE